MPFDFKKYDAKCATMDKDALQREWEHYTRLISGAATSTAVSGLAVPFTLGVSSIGVGLAAPAIHNARKKREIIERRMAILGTHHVTRKRDVLTPVAVSGTVGVLTLGVGSMGAEAIGAQAAEHGIATIVENELAVKVATHLALDAAVMTGEEIHMKAKKTDEAWKAYMVLVQAGKAPPPPPGTDFKKPPPAFATLSETAILDAKQSNLYTPNPSVVVLPPPPPYSPTADVDGVAYYPPPPGSIDSKVAPIPVQVHSSPEPTQPTYIYAPSVGYSPAETAQGHPAVAVSAGYSPAGPVQAYDPSTSYSVAGSAQTLYAYAPSVGFSPAASAEQSGQSPNLYTYPPSAGCSPAASAQSNPQHAQSHSSPSNGTPVPAGAASDSSHTNATMYAEQQYATSNSPKPAGTVATGVTQASVSTTPPPPLASSAPSIVAPVAQYWPCSAQSPPTSQAAVAPIYSPPPTATPAPGMVRPPLRHWPGSAQSPAASAVAQPATYQPTLSPPPPTPAPSVYSPAQYTTEQPQASYFPPPPSTPAPSASAEQTNQQYFPLPPGTLPTPAATPSLIYSNPQQPQEQAYFPPPVQQQDQYQYPQPKPQDPSQQPFHSYPTPAPTPSVYSPPASIYSTSQTPSVYSQQQSPAYNQNYGREQSQGYFPPPSAYQPQNASSYPVKNDYDRRSSWVAPSAAMSSPYYPPPPQQNADGGSTKRHSVITGSWMGSVA